MIHNVSFVFILFVGDGYDWMRFMRFGERRKDSKEK
jgi:hypothetical protein